MIYAATITTTADTAKVDALRTVLKVTKGLVWNIEIEYPPGCAGLMHVQVFDGLYQVFPASPGESIHSDSHLIGFDDLYLKTSGPFEFVIKTWNLDDTWNHTVQVRIAMASNEAFMSRYMPSLTWEAFKDSLVAAQLDQDRLKEEQQIELLKQIKDI